MKIISVVLMLLGSQISFANTLCVCQTGTLPKNQVAVFKAGCSTWLATKSCDEQKIISESDDLDQHIAQIYDGGEIKLSYVGHWSGAGQTKDFLKTKIIPLAQKRNLNFKIDNTACLGMDNAFEVQDLLKKLKSSGFTNKLEFKGNQVISLGMWDSFLGRSFNFHATASTEIQKVKFPTCRKFELKKCSRFFQAQAHGLCVNEENQLQKLQCKLNSRVTSVNEETGSEIISKRFEWVASDFEEEPYMAQAMNDKNEKVSLDDSSAVRFFIVLKSNPDNNYDEVFSREKAIAYVNFYNRESIGQSKKIKEWNIK